jgi:hypothetical protein
MPTWLELAKLLGFATPLIYAAAVYGAFHWLDKKASGHAKKAMTSWIQQPKQAIDPMVVIDLFDRIYTTPLLSVRAFSRSAIISLTVGVLVWYKLDLIPSHLFPTWDDVIELRLFFFVSILLALFFVLSDYISLFVVHRWLILFRRRPLFSLASGPIIGGCIIAVLWLVRAGLVILIFFRTQLFDIDPDEYVRIWKDIFSFMLTPSSESVPYFLPPMLVYLWLPLVGGAVIGAQLLTALPKAAGWMQWFIKQGQHHPFEALGYVAAAIVLAGTAAWQWIAR